MKSNQLLDKLFNEIDTVILARQHPVTGLLPASTAVNTHGDYTDAWVRDNVYSVMCVWALGMAYRKQGERNRSDQLEQATVKLMRGLLQSMMRQASKVEVFKHTLNPVDALHAKYDTATGLPVVGDHEWGHLQIDATSLFLLMLAQMTASGLRLVFTYSEVDFIQNLNYYIASAYRTHDFGIWERGNKINNGKTEINASSLGMAKAALQALDGFNLFGENASPRAVIHTVADAISLARSALASLLPRESLSKEVDSALLSIIGFPAFAVGDKNLVNKTRDKILSILGGNYGCKRFIWDGHQTVVEDGSRLYYEHSELADFENIESEWPLFFAFLYVDALFNENEATATYYREKLENLMVFQDGIGLIPELYYLPSENVAAEKKNPRSQARVPNDNIPLVWAQSLYLTGLMIDEDLLTPDDLDPLRMRRRFTRYVQTQVALVVLAENDEVKNTLAENGVIAESLDEIGRIKVIAAQHLVEAYAQVGANASLGLTGRPERRLQSLSTSQTYDINGNQFLCLSWMQGGLEDYRGHDAKRISLKIEQEISHIQKNWLNSEVAVFTIMLDQSTSRAPEAATLFKTLRDLQLKNSNSRVGYASAKLAFRASRTCNLFIPDVCITPVSFSRAYGDKTLADCVPDHLREDINEFVNAYQHLGDSQREDADRQNYILLEALTNKNNLDDNIGIDEEYLFSQLTELVYRISCQDNHWMTARFCFNVLGKVHNVLADGLLLLNSRHLSVVLGNDNTRQLQCEGTANNKEIASIINQMNTSAVEKTLTQELIAIIGSLARTNPELFDGIRSIYVHSFLLLCAKAQQPKDQTPDIEQLASQSPSDFLDSLSSILQTQHQSYSQGVGTNYSQSDDQEKLAHSEAEQAHAVDTDWLEWRAARGLIQRFDESFLNDIWQSLTHVRFIIFGDLASQECALDADITRRSMTAGEESFARLIDQYSQQVHPPYYKSAVLETLYAYAQYCKQNEDADFGHAIDLGTVLEAAANAYVQEENKTDLSSRNVDVFMEQSPMVLQKYAQVVMKDFNVKIKSS